MCKCCPQNIWAYGMFLKPLKALIRLLPEIIKVANRQTSGQTDGQTDEHMTTIANFALREWTVKPRLKRREINLQRGERVRESVACV